MRKRITRSLLIGFLLAILSMFVVALLALLVWYRDKPWGAEISVPTLVSLPLLLPIQTWAERRGSGNDLLFLAVVAAKTLIYATLAFTGSLVWDVFVRRRQKAT
jgi:hypothetical protein